MIITVTMNPALDKTIELDFLMKGELNRINRVIKDAGGKGINVSKTLAALGKESIATGFLGGSTGTVIENSLKTEFNIKQDFVWVDGDTRTNTKIVESDGTVTEINERGVEVSKEQLETLMLKLEDYANENTLFVLAGSVPNGVDKNIYAQIIERVHKKGAACLLDADGEAFKLAMEAKEKPDVIKPNHIELAGYADKDKLNAKEIAGIAFNILQNGVKTVAVSMGSKGAILFKNGECIGADAVDVPTHSTVGAGDAFVAGLALAFDENLSAKDTMKLCMAVSAGAVTTEGTKPPTKELVDELITRVILK